MTATVRIDEVTKHYGRINAVTDVSFDLEEDEMVALIGHNGAGKTTLMKLMLGLIRPTGGSIMVLGDNPAAGQFAGRRHLGYLPENVSFDAALTGRETQTFFARLKREPVAKALELLDAVGLAAVAGRRVGTYSKGMRQRLGLAQALLGRPQVLLGKFFGHLAVLGFATCLGYGIAAAALVAAGSRIDHDSLAAFAAMIGSSVLLGAIFVAIGYLVSSLVRDRGTAAGISIGLWLFLVLIYDMALLGLLALDQGRNISATALNTMLLFNPTDVYRLFNLTGFANVSTFAGMAGLAQSTSLSIQLLLLTLTLWMVIPLGIAALAFSRREL